MFITGEFINDNFLTDIIEIPELKKSIDELIKDFDESEKKRINKNFEESGLLEVPIEFLKLKIKYKKEDKRKERFFIL